MSARHRRRQREVFRPPACWPLVETPLCVKPPDPEPIDDAKLCLCGHRRHRGGGCGAVVEFMAATSISPTRIVNCDCKRDEPASPNRAVAVMRTVALWDDPEAMAHLNRVLDGMLSMRRDAAR